MESIPSTPNVPDAGDTSEVLEELPEWKVDSTFQHRVNNVCTKLLRRGVRPTYQRVRANLGEPPARLLREALQTWSTKILPGLYSAPGVEWAERPKAISPRVAELFEEMWLQAVSAAQVHYELGDDSSARLTHRETIDMICHELRRVNTRVSCVANAAQRLDHGMRSNNETAGELRADIQCFLQAFQTEIGRLSELSAAVESMLAIVSRESERQASRLAEHLEVCHEVKLLERARRARVKRLARKAVSILEGRKPKLKRT